MGKLASYGSAELRSHAYNGSDAFIGVGACHAPHLWLTCAEFSSCFELSLVIIKFTKNRGTNM
ncbi:hypothetical protein OIU77_019353 [Salix suchowensis]|uniref:Uncharacterized protein n=1 Tax=Salix suchowensis TaxID=1278906 RepID=A0ABQ9CJV5_9ROSI|nr:hypothetical protein OIU77_019353 [Salix suchowensis]